jgi:ribonuclease P protein component
MGVTAPRPYLLPYCPTPLLPSAVIQHLTKRSEFLFVRQGVRSSRASVMIEARRRAGDGPIRLGLTASKKVGNAVQRNRARRRLREAARQLLPELGLPGVDYVLVARQHTPDAPWAGLLDDVRNALIRLRADLEPGGAADRRETRARTPSQGENKGARRAKGD